MPLEEDRILRGPNIRFPEQHLGFRPPEQPQSPPSWWTGPRVGDILGGGMTDPNMVHTWWRDIAESGDPFVVQLTAEDRISGVKVWRTPTRLACKVKADSLDSAQARKMAAALSEAADLVDKG
jgi:hypothetical protein